MFHGNDSFLGREVGQQRRRHDITDCIDSFFGGLLILIDLDEALFHFDLGSFQTKSLGVGHAANSNQQHFRFQGDSFALGVFSGNANSVVGLLELLELRVD